MRSLLATALALVPWPGSAADPVSIESIAAGYSRLESYCDSGKRGWRSDPKQASFTQLVSFERCVRRDGRFKDVEKEPQAGVTATWSDAKKYYRYMEYSAFFQETSLDDPMTYGLYRDRSQILPVFVFQAFARDPRDFANPSSRPRYLQSYQPSSALSTPRHSVFERFESNGHESERLWVLNEDGAIVKHEAIRDGVVMRFAEIESHAENRALSDADLRYEVPFQVRHSASNSPAPFFAAMAGIACAIAALTWAWFFSRAAEPETLRRMRRRLWRINLRALGVVALALAALAVASIPGGGHPPAIVYVMALAIWCAFAFALAAILLLVSYPVEWLVGAVLPAARRDLFRRSPRSP